MARSWSWAEWTPTPTPWPARNCMTQPPATGLRPVRSTPNARATPRRCCPTARCWSWEAWTPVAIPRATPRFTIRPAALGIRLTRLSASDLVPTRRRCWPTASCWSRGAIPAAFSPARNCTIGPAGRGSRPAHSTPRAICIRRPCCPMARFWPWEAPAVRCPARSCIIRPMERGPQPAH